MMRFLFIIPFFLAACSEEQPVVPQQIDEPIPPVESVGLSYDGSRIQLVDTNGDGRISRDEFVQANPGISDSGAALLFQRLDPDVTGFISVRPSPSHPIKDSHAIQK